MKEKVKSWALTFFIVVLGLAILIPNLALVGTFLKAILSFIPLLD